MKASKQTPATLRYFKASLKPFRNFWFWGPPLILAVGGLGIWHYQTHPEWLDMTTVQPPPGQNPIDDSSEQIDNSANLNNPGADSNPLDNTQTNGGASQPSLTGDSQNKNWQDLYKGQLKQNPDILMPSSSGNKDTQNPSQPKDVLEQLTKKPNGQLFPPLIPTSSANRPASEPIKPRELTLAKPSGGNPLGEAIDKLPSVDYSRSGSQSQTFTGTNTGISVNQPPSVNNNYPGQGVQVPQQVPTYQSPYNPYPSVQTQTPTYQSPYNPYPSVPTQVPTYQSPYGANNYSGTAAPVPQTSVNPYSTNPYQYQTPPVQGQQIISPTGQLY